MNLHFQGLYPREISLVTIGLILTVSFPIVEATDLTDFNLPNYLIEPTPEDHIGIITTDKPVYYVGGDANAILAYGVIPTDMPICPSPYDCEGYGPSIGIYDPNGNRKITLQHVPYPYDGALKVEDRNFWSSINRFGSLIAGCWELKLYSGVHLSGTLLDARSFLVTESGNEVTVLCEEEPPSDPPVTNSTTTDPPVTNSTTTDPPVTNSTTTDIEDSSTTIVICHIPPGNPENPQTISIPENSWPSHVEHGDVVGECNDYIIEINSSNSTTTDPILGNSNSTNSTTITNSDYFTTIIDESGKNKKELKKEIIKEKVKKQKEKTKKKSELTSYRDDFNKIKSELKLFKEQGKNTDNLSNKLLSIISDFQKTFNILIADFEYDKEYKSEIRAELKEKKKSLNEKMTKSEQNFNRKVSSKLSELSHSNDLANTAKELGLDYKNGKTTITISLTNVNQNVLDKLESIGRVDAVADNQVQLTVNIKNIKDLGSVPGVEFITPSFSAVQSSIQKSENDGEPVSVDYLNEVFTSIQSHFGGIFS